jgi:hypothetical protein
MTHKLTIKDKDYLLVGIDKSQRRFEISKKKDISKDYYHLEGINFSSLFLSNNPCKIINTISNLTEKECISLVDTALSIGEEYYKDYDNQTSSGTFFTAKESFISLLKSKNILAKSFVDEPKEFIKSKFNDNNPFESFSNDSKQILAKLKYQNLSDEMLLIEINN